jgi:hypothetical protein
VRHSSVDFAELLKPGRQTIIRVPSHEIGLHIGPLIQSVVLVKLWFAVLWRTTRTREEERTPLVLYLDEFQDLQRLQAIQTILSQARSQGLCLLLSHQTTAQLDDTLLKIVIGNCVLGDSTISGAYIPISKMRLGDVCMGAEGLQKTTATFMRHYDGEMLVLRALGILPLTLTPEHPLLTVPRLGPKYKGRHTVIGTRWGEPTWKFAKDIVPTGRHQRRGDYLVIPRLRGTIRTRRLSLRPFATDDRAFAISKGWGKSMTFPLNEDTAWLLGVYAAEGCGKDKAIFCFNRNETELQEKVIDLGRRFCYSPVSTFYPGETLVTVPSRLLARAFQKWCGHGATNKRIPEFILFHRDTRLLKAFLDGYLAGDGSTNRKRAAAVTSSKVLAFQVRLGFARLGRFFGINVKRREVKGHIQGRVVQLHESYSIMNTESWVHIFPDKILVPVHRKEAIKYRGMVYNLGTEDNTFLVNNIVGHNCGIQGAGRVSGDDASRLARAWDPQYRREIEQALVTQPDFTWTFRLRAGPGEEQSPPVQETLLKPPEEKHSEAEIRVFCAKMKELYGADRTERSVFDKKDEKKPEWVKFLPPGQAVPTKEIWWLLITEEAPPRLRVSSG